MIFDPGNFEPLIFWPHVALGFAAAVFSAVALVSTKGGVWHRRAGQLFAGAMSIAAVTAIYFFLAGPPAPPVLISASAALYAIGMGILSLRQRSGGWLALQCALVIIPILAGLLYVSFAAFAVMAPDIPIYLAIAGPAAGALFLVIAWKDLQFLRTAKPSRSRRLRRHGFRMALVAAEVVRAPLVSMGPPIIGAASFDLYAYGAFALVPLFYFLAIPRNLVREPSSARAPAS